MVDASPEELRERLDRALQESESQRAARGRAVNALQRFVAMAEAWIDRDFRAGSLDECDRKTQELQKLLDSERRAL